MLDPRTATAGDFDKAAQRHAHVFWMWLIAFGVTWWLMSFWWALIPAAAATWAAIGSGASTRDAAKLRNGTYPILNPNNGAPDGDASNWLRRPTEPRSQEVVDMHVETTPSLAAPTQPAVRIAVYASLFWAFTYSLFSARAYMMMGDDFELLSSRRLVSITVGACLFGVVMTTISARRWSAWRTAAIISTILPASLTVFAIRFAFDQFWHEQPSPPHETLRWVMVWAGYFGLWVSAALALSRTSASPIGSPENPPAAVIPVHSGDGSRSVDEPATKAGVKLGNGPARR